MAKKYRIVFDVNATQGITAANQMAAAFQKVHTAAQQAGGTMARTFTQGGQAAVQAKQTTVNRLGALEDRYLLREYQGRVRHHARLQQQAERDASRLEQIQDRYFQRDQRQRASYEAKKDRDAERAANKAAMMASRKADQLQRVEDRFIQRDYRQQVAAQARKEREQQKGADRAAALAARKADQLQRIEDRWLRREYKERAAFQAKLEQDEEAASERQAQRAVRAAAMLTGAALAGVHLMGEEYRRIRDNAVEAAEATLQLKKYLRVEATLRGEPGVTNKALREHLQFRAQTGLGREEASDFVRQFEGSLPIGLQTGNITPKVAEELKLKAGQMAARQGGDAGTRGELAGLLGQFGKIESAEQGLAQLEAIRIALVEGRGDDTPLTKQLLKTAGEMVGEGERVPDIVQMAALTGVASLSPGAGRASTHVRQANKFLGKTKGKGLNYLKRIGITEHDTFEERIDKLFADTSKAKAAGRDVATYLGEQVGGGNQEEIRSAVEILKLYKPFKERMAKARAAMAQGAQVDQANQQFLRTPEGRAAVGEALQDVAVVSRGARNQRAAALLKEAEASPEFQREEGQFGTGFYDRMRGYSHGFLTNPVEEGRRLRLQYRASEILKKRAVAAGIGGEEYDKLFDRYYRRNTDGTAMAPGAGMGNDPEWFARFVNAIESKMEAKGGNVSADIKPSLDRLNKNLEEFNRMVAKQLGGKGAPPAIGGPPPGGPVRP